MNLQYLSYVSYHRVTFQVCSFNEEISVNQNGMADKQPIDQSLLPCQRASHSHSDETLKRKVGEGAGDQVHNTVIDSSSPSLSQAKNKL